MQRRHEDALLARLESIITHGAAQMNWAELRQWYDIQKIAVRTYRDIENRWQEITSGRYGQLVFVPIRHGQTENYGFWLFADGASRMFSELAKQTD